MTDKEKIMSEDYYDFLTDSPREEGFTGYFENGLFLNIENDLSLVYIKKDEMSPQRLRGLIYRDVPKLFGLMGLERGAAVSFDPEPLMKCGILQVQGAPLNLTGRGVVLGFLDTGIRYDEEVFRNPDGSTRILGIWDQEIQSGQPPAGFLYGTEYTRELIQAALQSEKPRQIVPSYDENGHGTEIASVAAGSILSGGLRFQGAAPDADIVVVKLKQAKRYLTESFFVPDGVTAYEENDVIAAVKYLEGYAVSMRRPLVICMGIGTNMGNHEGQSLLAEYLNSVATRRSRSVVVCGGDEGNSAHHFIGYATAGMKQSTENVEIRVDAGEKGFVAELWGTMPATHAISIRAPGGEITDPVDFKVQETREFTFIYEKTVIRVNHSLVEPGSGGELTLFRFQDPTPGIWTIQVTTTGAEYDENGNFHIWLPITQFLGGDTYFLRPSPYVTLTEPGNTREVITTTYYQDSNNSFYGESGRGFSRRGNVKPELCTPGVEISTVLGSRTGSAFGAALLAGICAQFLQWAVVDGRERWLESREVKNYLVRGAVRPPGIQFPSREWGYGQVNIAKTFDVIAGI